MNHITLFKLEELFHIIQILGQVESQLCSRISTVVYDTHWEKAQEVHLGSLTILLLGLACVTPHPLTFPMFEGYTSPGFGDHYLGDPFLLRANPVRGAMITFMVVLSILLLAMETKLLRKDFAFWGIPVFLNLFGGYCIHSSIERAAQHVSRVDTGQSLEWQMWFKSLPRGKSSLTWNNHEIFAAGASVDLSSEKQLGFYLDVETTS